MEEKKNEHSFFPGEQIECTKCPISRPIPQQKRKSDRQAAQQQQQQAGNSLDGGPGPGGGGGRREEEACDNGIMRRTVTELTVDAC